MKNLNCFASGFSLMPSRFVFQNAEVPSEEPRPKSAEEEVKMPPPSVDTAMKRLERVEVTNKSDYEKRKQETTDRLVAKYKDSVDEHGYSTVEDASKSEFRAPATAKEGDIFVREPGIRGEPPTFRMLENGNFRPVNYGESLEEITPDKFEAHILNIKQKWDKRRAEKQK